MLKTIALALVVCSPAEDKELEKVQGKWERTVTTADGTPIRVVKEITGNSETVTYFGPNGKVLQAHRVEFKLETSGKVKIFTYFNGIVTAGPRKGSQKKDPTSYVYRVEDDMFFEVMGILVGSKEKPEIIVWKRPKPKII